MELFPYMMGSYSLPRQDRKRFFPEGAIEKLRWSSSYQDDMGPGLFFLLRRGLIPSGSWQMEWRKVSGVKLEIFNESKGDCHPGARADTGWVLEEEI